MDTWGARSPMVACHIEGANRVLVATFWLASPRTCAGSAAIGWCGVTWIHQFPASYVDKLQGLGSSEMNLGRAKNEL